MRNFLLTLLLQSVIVFAYGQQTYYSKPYDFSSIDPSRVNTKVLGQQWDSLYAASGADSLSQLIAYVRLRQKTVQYVAFIVGYQRDKALLGDLNNSLQSLGFGALSEDFNGIPIGFEGRGKRFTGAWIATFGLKNSVRNRDYTVKVSGVNMQLVLGYDLLNLKRLHFYPQVTAGLQAFDLQAKRKSATTDITDVEGLFSHPTGASLTRTSFDLGYGVELDYRLIYGSSGGLILGLRYGQSVMAAKGKFDLNGDKSSFKLDDRLNESFLQVVLKIYGKN
jgi:hypothetical protein